MLKKEKSRYAKSFLFGNVDGDILNLSLPQPSNELDVVEHGGINYDLSQIVGYKFTFRDDVLTIGEGDYGVELFKDSTDKGKEYLELFTGRETTGLSGME